MTCAPYMSRAYLRATSPAWTRPCNVAAVSSLPQCSRLLLLLLLSFFYTLSTRLQRALFYRQTAINFYKWDYFKDPPAVAAAAATAGKTNCNLFFHAFVIVLAAQS